MNDREKRIDNLSPSAGRFVARMADLLSSPPKVSVRQEAAMDHRLPGPDLNILAFPVIGI